MRCASSTPSSDTVLAHASSDAGVRDLSDAQPEQQVQVWNDVCGSLSADADPNLHAVRERLLRMEGSAFSDTLEALLSQFEARRGHLPADSRRRAAAAPSRGAWPPRECVPHAR